MVFSHCRHVPLIHIVEAVGGSLHEGRWNNLVDSVDSARATAHVVPCAEEEPWNVCFPGMFVFLLVGILFSKLPLAGL